MKKHITTILLMLAVTFGAAAQGTDKVETDKEGLSFGAFPILGYDALNGWQFGLRTAGYDFGHKGEYPNPRQTLYAEASWTLKGSQYYVLSYDNRFLIPTVRFTFTARFTDEKAGDFYGFGGYESWYDASLPDAYYRIGRKVPYGKLDFTGRIAKNFYWKFGYHFRYFILNEYEHSSLSAVPYGKTLFSWYKSMGFIEGDEFKGGMTSAWRAGLSYDSRDAENDPVRGVWADAFMEWAPKWMGTNKPYGRYYAVLRQYIPLSGDRLVFAYRANVQGFIGKPAFYVLPYESVLGPGWDQDGFGGYYTVRGVMRNRIQGQSLCYFNTEFRWKFLTTSVLGQDLTFVANAFFDGGRVLKNYTDVSADPATWKIPVAEGKFPEQLTKGGKEGFHLSGGAGLRVVLNRNFVVSLDYGHAFNLQDNKPLGTLYFNTGFLF